MLEHKNQKTTGICAIIELNQFDLSNLFNATLVD